MTPEWPPDEIAKKTTFTPPAVELLLDPKKIDSLWPAEVTNNPAFREQIEKRHALAGRLDDIISRLPRPDTSLQDALSNNIITEEQITRLYQSLSDLLSDKDYIRAALYLPFEFLPGVTWKPQSEELQSATKQFQTTYMAAWNSLLNTYDVRANFTDGDVLEPESRVDDHPRVVKAAHLIPQLVERGLLSIDQVINLLATSKSAIQKQSITESLAVLVDLNLLSESELARLTISTPPRTEPTKSNGGITEKRTAWLAQEENRKRITDAAHAMSEVIQSGSSSPETLITTASGSPEAQQALIDGVREAVELLAKTDPARARNIFQTYEDPLLALGHRATPEVRDALLTTFSRLNGLGIVSNERLAELGITIPALAGPFSKNLASMSQEVVATKRAITALETDPTLSKYVYPVALIYGSRLKGYNNANSDMDVAVFIKPGTAVDNRPQLRSALKTVFTAQKITGDIVEFWLEKDADKLAIHDFEHPDVLQGDSSWTHVLFGAAWEGDEKTIKALREKLLVPYFQPTDKIVEGEPARSRYLESLERDTLQYRLMHRGYAKFFPSFGGIHTTHANQIDGQSTFWDSGYRQTALRLYASRVFLPSLSR